MFLVKSRLSETASRLYIGPTVINHSRGFSSATHTRDTVSVSMYLLLYGAWLRGFPPRSVSLSFPADLACATALAAVKS